MCTLGSHLSGGWSICSDLARCREGSGSSSRPTRCPRADTLKLGASSPQGQFSWAHPTSEGHLLAAAQPSLQPSGHMSWRGPFKCGFTGRRRGQHRAVGPQRAVPGSFCRWCRPRCGGGRGLGTGSRGRQGGRGRGVCTAHLSRQGASAQVRGRRCTCRGAQGMESHPQPGRFAGPRAGTGLRASGAHALDPGPQGGGHVPIQEGAVQLGRAAEPAVTSLGRGFLSCPPASSSIRCSEQRNGRGTVLRRGCGGLAPASW